MEDWFVWLRALDTMEIVAEIFGEFVMGCWKRIEKIKRPGKVINEVLDMWERRGNFPIIPSIKSHLDWSYSKRDRKRWKRQITAQYAGGKYYMRKKDYGKTLLFLVLKWMTGR
jgi:hypothetical protein